MTIQQWLDTSWVDVPAWQVYQINFPEVINSLRIPSQQRLFHCNSNSMKISFTVIQFLIMTSLPFLHMPRYQFLHMPRRYSCRLKCKNCSDRSFRIWMWAKQNFHHIWIVVGNCWWSTLLFLHLFDQGYMSLGHNLCSKLDDDYTSLTRAIYAFLTQMYPGMRSFVFPHKYERPGVGVTKATFVNFSVCKIFDLAKVPLKVFESHSYLTGVTAAELRQHLSNMNLIFNS